MQLIASQKIDLHQEFLVAWVMRTIRARYKQSLLGGFWAILQPAAMVASSANPQS